MLSRSEGFGEDLAGSGRPPMPAWIGRDPRRSPPRSINAHPGSAHLWSEARIYGGFCHDACARLDGLPARSGRLVDLVIAILGYIVRRSERLSGKSRRDEIVKLGASAPSRPTPSNELPARPPQRPAPPGVGAAGWGGDSRRRSRGSRPELYDSVSSGLRVFADSL